MAQGLVWGWRVLKPGEPFTEAAPEKTGTYNAIILLTDGQQTGGDGDSYKAIWGISSAARDELDDRARLIAANAKADGVKIYAIQYIDGSSSLQDLMKEIASGPGSPYYFLANDGAELNTIFEAIGAQLQTIRLAK